MGALGTILTGFLIEKRERGSLPEAVVELQTRTQSMMQRKSDAVADCDFEKARAYCGEDATNATSCICCVNNLSSWTGSTSRPRFVGKLESFYVAVS